MKSEARGKKSFILISATILLCIFLTGMAIAQIASISEARPILIQGNEAETEKTEELLTEELLLEPPTGYLERDYRILTQEYGTAASSTATIRKVGGIQQSGVLDINPLLLDSEPILIAPGLTNKTISTGTFVTVPELYSPVWNLNGYTSDFSSIAFGINDIFSYNRQNNAYNKNYGYNFSYNFANNPPWGWYGLPSSNNIIPGLWNKYNGYEGYLTNNRFYLLNQFINSKRNNAKGPDPVPPAQLEEADVSLYADADGGAITLSEGETLSIVLESNVTTGYSWELNDELLDSQVLEKINSQYLSGPFDENEPLLGAGGYEQWIFQATGEGATTVELNYKHSWDEDIIDTFTIEVTVEPANGTGGGIGLANPASVYCIENGGISEIRTNELGSYGVCIFSDGTECDEWAYFRGECGQ